MIKSSVIMIDKSIPGAAVLFAGGKSVVEGVQSRNGSGMLPSVLLPSGTP